MNTETTPQRCRIVLIAPPAASADELVKQLGNALSGGDVASVLLPAYDADETLFQTIAEAVVPVVQKAGAAAIIVGNTQIAGRVKADGLHIEGPVADIAANVARFSPKMIVGTGNIKNRHTALEIGEAQPDYVLFGKIGADNKPEAHPRNIELADWWASMIEIPCIIQAGNTLDSITDAVLTGAEFIALGAAIFDGSDPASAVKEANRLLDEHAPGFEE
ncbi:MULTISPECIES: thiamine phosphate synthase [Phyllobacterium]|jgi:thiamine-phosphate pyrophosphorylase|uniref:Thiamine phosphate synthase n=1 Tax=Phyllobacterium sophorae TaxID=1520277 RepID=A0A2P7AY91_9HYPH|nr:MULTISPECIES: thiamine phosphate synthase [Phyllobacterium]PSH59190.1 thiamine phosphate synthase [Phyllobacterium sophorae]UXN65052.1 thiamine phosphate synthase [Phyllobacterium sp. A18/5-2]